MSQPLRAFAVTAYRLLEGTVLADIAVPADTATPAILTMTMATVSNDAIQAVILTTTLALLTPVVTSGRTPGALVQAGVGLFTMTGFEEGTTGADTVCGAAVTGTLVTTNPRAFGPGHSLKSSGAIGATGAVLNLTGSGDDSTPLYGRFYWRPSAFTMGHQIGVNSNFFRIIKWSDGTVSGGFVLGFGQAYSGDTPVGSPFWGVGNVNDSSYVAFTGNPTITVGTWYRVEVHVAPGAAHTAVITLYAEDGTSPLGTHTTSQVMKSGIVALSLGNTVSAFDAITYQFDDVAMGVIAAWGPGAVYTLQPGSDVLTAWSPGGGGNYLLVPMPAGTGVTNAGDSITREDRLGMTTLITTGVPHAVMVDGRVSHTGTMETRLGIRDHNAVERRAATGIVNTSAQRFHDALKQYCLEWTNLYPEFLNLWSMGYAGEGLNTQRVTMSYANVDVTPP
jgi:hypothetical protein